MSIKGTILFFFFLFRATHTHVLIHWTIENLVPASKRHFDARSRSYFSSSLPIELPLTIHSCISLAIIRESVWKFCGAESLSKTNTSVWNETNPESRIYDSIYKWNSMNFVVREKSANAVNRESLMIRMIIKPWWQLIHIF